MNQTMRSMIPLLLVSAFILRPSSFLWADGGTVRLSEQQGDYRITVFTAPIPLRAGPVDISVFVQEAATAEPVPEVRVTIKAVRRGSFAAAICHPATTAAATNKLYHAALFNLPEPGWYALEVSVDGALGEARVCFEVEAAEPLPQWLVMWPLFGWPVVAIVLFGVHQLLVRGRSRRAVDDLYVA
jgi:hypothetical protein